MPSAASRVVARFIIATCLILPATAVVAQTGGTTTLTVESTLELNFGQDKEGGPYGVHGMKSVERRLLVIPGAKVVNADGARQAVMVLEAEIRREEELDAKGVDGTVKVTAWQYGPEATRKKLYSFEAPGMDLVIHDSFIITEDFADVDAGSWLRYFFANSGEFAFQTFGRAPQAQFIGTSERPTGKVVRYASFDPGMSGQKWPDVDGGVVGLLTYADGKRVLARSLLVHQDRDVARILSNIADESHRLDFVDHNRRVSSDGRPMETMVSDQKLRLRFRGSNIDIYIPLKEDGFDSEAPLQSLPPGFRLVPYMPAKL
jgi:hypothetical protein